MSQTYTIDAVVNYPNNEESDTPTCTKLTRKGLHEWLDKLLDSEPDLTSFIATVVKEV